MKFISFEEAKGMDMDSIYCRDATIATDLE